VYAFGVDILVFKQKFTVVEILGATVITFFNLVTLIERGKMQEEEQRKQRDELVTVSELKSIPYGEVV
jgi:hypothetical protein